MVRGDSVFGLSSVTELLCKAMGTPVAVAVVLSSIVSPLALVVVPR